MAEITRLRTGAWERGERVLIHAVSKLDAYVARRRAKGETVAVVKPPYRVGQVRAVLSVDGARVRVFYLEERGAWRAA